MNKKKSILESNLLYTLIAIVAGFIIGAVFLMIAGISPAVAYGKLIDSVFGKPKYLAWVLTYASPLIFTGLSVAFSFRTGVFNIGAEGQFVVGSLVACVLGITLKLPAVIHIPLCLLAAAAAGAGGAGGEAGACAGWACLRPAPPDAGVPKDALHPAPSGAPAPAPPHGAQRAIVKMGMAATMQLSGPSRQYAP